MNKFEELRNLENLNRVALIGHIQPDADALCSMVVFRYILLNKFNVKNIALFADFDELPSYYDEIYEGITLNPAETEFDAVVLLDCSSVERTGRYATLFNTASTTYVIDHHATNLREGKFNFVETVSSTCEIVYDIAKSFDFELPKEMCGRLYAGIITDTNNLSVGERNSNTYNFVGEMCSKINMDKIHENFLANNSLKNMQLLSLAIRNIYAMESEQILVSHISHEEAEMYHVKFDDYTGIINSLATISGNKLVCFIESNGPVYYVSMRAKKGYDVSVIAQKHNGGGHKGAAAFNSTEPLEVIEETIKKEFVELLHSSKPEKENVF